MRAIVSSEVDVADAPDVVPCAWTDTAQNRNPTKAKVRKRMATSVDDANHLNTTGRLSRRGYDAGHSAIRAKMENRAELQFPITTLQELGL